MSKKERIAALEESLKTLRRYMISQDSDIRALRVRVTDLEASVAECTPLPKPDMGALRKGVKDWNDRNPVQCKPPFALDPPLKEGGIRADEGWKYIGAGCWTSPPRSVITPPPSAAPWDK